MMKNRVASLILGISCAIGVSACGTIDNRHVPSSQSGKLRTGQFPYFLPKAVIAISATATLKNCVTGADGIAQLDINVEGSAVASIEADGKEQYVISYESLRGPFTDSQMRIERYPNGTLKGINSTMTDQAGPVAAAVALTAVKIASAVTLGAAVPSPALAMKSQSALNDKLAAIDKALSAIKKDATAPDQACSSETLQALSLASKLQGLLDQLDAAIPYAADAKELEFIQAKKVALHSRLDAAKKPLTQQIYRVWTPMRPEKSEGTVTSITDSINVGDVAKKWVKPDRKFSTGNKAATVRLDFVTGTVGKGSQTAVDGKEAAKGLVIVDPAQAMMRFCGTMSCDQQDDPKAVKVFIPQLGSKLVLPLEDELFESASLEIAINSDTSIGVLGFKDSSSLPAAVGTAGQAADAYSASIAARNAAIGAANTAHVSEAQFPATYNKAVADCLTQRDAVLKACGTPMSCQ